MCLYSYITIYTVRVSDEYQPVRESSEGAARKKESVPNLEYSTEWETKKVFCELIATPYGDRARIMTRGTRHHAKCK